MGCSSTTKLDTVATVAATISTMASPVREEGIDSKQFPFLTHSIQYRKLFMFYYFSFFKINEILQSTKDNDLMLQYQETMKQMSGGGFQAGGQPPLPKEDVTKPPLPPETSKPYQFTNLPPPHQNNLPLFPEKQLNSGKPPLPQGPPPLPPDHDPSKSNPNSAKKVKVDEDLSEAEKTFDAQFKQWEAQFNTWKQQNANHPDKVRL